MWTIWLRNLNRPHRTTGAAAITPITAALVSVFLFSACGIHAQITPAAAPPVPTTPLSPQPSAATAACITDAQAKVKAHSFAEATAALSAAKTPGLASADVRALDFALADARRAWGGYLILTSHYVEAVVQLNAALTIDQSDPERQPQLGNDVQRIGITWMYQGQSEKALSYYQQALAIFQRAKDGNDEASALSNIGNAYLYLSQYGKAVGYFEQSLPILRQFKNRNDEAVALNSLGLAYLYQSQYDKAIRYYELALPIFQEVNSKIGAAYALTNMGTAYLHLSQYEKTIGLYQQALPILHSLNDQNGEASALSNVGVAYLYLSQYEKAISFYNQALPILRQVKNQNGEAQALDDMGLAYSELTQYQTALGNFDKALSIFQQLKDRDGQAMALTNMGTAYRGLSQHLKAISCYQDALPIFQEVGDRDGEASTLTDQGVAFENLNMLDKANRSYDQALTIMEEVKDRTAEAETLGDLRAFWANDHNPHRNVSLAILYGKMAVNVLQSIRADIHGMDEATQHGYARSKESDYRGLADLLIAQGRLLEAQQVLGLLKEQEFFDFVRRDAGDASTLGKADLTVLERLADATIDAQDTAVASLATEFDTLKDKHDRTASEQARMDVLRPQLQSARENFQKKLASLSTLFAAHAGSVAQQDVDIKDSPALARTLTTLRKTTRQAPVAVYTLVGEKTLRFLVYTTDGVPVAREYRTESGKPIGAADLRRKVYAFRDALQNPHVDPRPLGKQLYDILIGPVARDLDGAHATEVMWSLDDALRYLPLAALSSDGIHFLIEEKNRRHSIFTPATLTASALTASPSQSWSALALGVSKPHIVKTVTGDDDFRALPGVPAEIDGIVKAPGGGGSDGVMQGTILLDDQFTKAALEKALEDGHGQFPVVHIASHFNFKPGGDDGSSYLLLGDGTPLSLAEIKNLSTNLFADVDLLTLSACDTATGGTGDKDDPGAEVESFGTLAQRQGAAAVLASLWPVSDASTPALMQAFYRLRQSQPDLPKAEALRQAQVALLDGTVKLVSGAGARGIPDFAPPPPTKDAPAFTPDPAKPWAHPYYWAPFILIGNWK